LIRDLVGPHDADHYFVFSLHASGTLIVALRMESGVAGVQLIRGVSTGGAIDPGKVLSTSSTLIDNPAMICCPLDAGAYFVRVYHIVFGDASYDLTLDVGLEGDAQAPKSANYPIPLAIPIKLRRRRHASRLRLAGKTSRGRVLDNVRRWRTREWIGASLTRPPAEMRPSGIRGTSMPGFHRADRPSPEATVANSGSRNED